MVCYPFRFEKNKRWHPLRYILHFVNFSLKVLTPLEMVKYSCSLLQHRQRTKLYSKWCYFIRRNQPSITLSLRSFTLTPNWTLLLWFQLLELQYSSQVAVCVRSVKFGKINVNHNVEFNSTLVEQAFKLKYGYVKFANLF